MINQLELEIYGLHLIAVLAKLAGSMDVGLLVIFVLNIMGWIDMKLQIFISCRISTKLLTFPSATAVVLMSKS